MFCYANRPSKSENLHAGEVGGIGWREFMSVLIGEEIDKLLETTSRSFYPTLKYLPKKIAAKSDCCTFCACCRHNRRFKVGETEVLIDALTNYNDVAQGRSDTLPDLRELADIQSNPDEGELLRNVQQVIDALSVYGQEDQERCWSA